jgi:hypothetical protein
MLLTIPLGPVDGRVSADPRHKFFGAYGERAANRIRVGQGIVRCWLLALFGPVALCVKAAVPVVPGLVASLAGGDDAAS